MGLTIVAAALCIAFIGCTQERPEVKVSSRQPSAGPAEQIFIEAVETARTGNIEEARRALVPLTLSHPRFPDVYRKLHELAIEDGRVEETLVLFDRLHARDPSNGLPVIYKAITLMLVGREREATAEFKRSVLADPDNLDLAYPAAAWMPFGQRLEEMHAWVREQRAALGERPLLVCCESKCLTDQMRIDEARRYWLRASSKLSDHFWVAWINTWYSLASKSRGEIPPSVGFTEEYRSLMERTRQAGSPQAVAGVASEEGWAHEISGDQIVALRVQREALMEAERADFKELICHARKNLGRLYVALNDLEAARRELEAGDPLCRRFGSARSRGDLDSEWGKYYEKAGEMEKALAHYRMALFPLRRHEQKTMRTSETLVRMARVHRILGDRSEARVVLDEAESVARESGNRRALALALLERARLREAEGDTGAARLLLESGIREAVTSEAPIHADLLAEKLRLSRIMGEGDAAVAAARAWVETVGRQGRSNTPGSSLDAFLVDKAETAARVIGLFWDDQDARGRERALVAAAELRGLSMKRRLDGPGHSPAANRSDGNPVLTAGLAGLRQALLSPPQHPGKARHPAVLVYWSGTERSFLWLLTRETFASWSLPGRRVLGDDVAARLRLLAGVGAHHGVEHAQPGRDSSRADPGEGPFPFLPPEAVRLLADADSLLVSADGPLATLPFEILVTPAGRLIERAPVIYTPLVAPGMRSPTEIPLLSGPSLVVAFPRAAPARNGERGPQAWSCPPPSAAATPGSPALTEGHPSALRFAAREADEIVRILRGAGLDVASADPPTPAAVLSSRAAGGSVLHLAVHACVDRHRPDLSYLVLAPDDPRKGVWQPLFAQQIRRSSLDFGLAILSSCSGYDGREYAGEGMVSLGRAFHEAGIPYVVASLWDVEDAASGLLMRAFWRGLVAGAEPAVALRDAKLSLLRSHRPVLREPHFWAPFLLSFAPVGNGGARVLAASRVDPNLVERAGPTRAESPPPSKVVPDRLPSP